jgi:hypothetical protein
MQYPPLACFGALVRPPRLTPAALGYLRVGYLRYQETQ